MIDSLGWSDFEQKLKSGNYILIDIRTKEEEIRFGNIPNTAYQFDIYQENTFISSILQLPRDGKYLLYCWHGNRTKYALSFMEQNGFQEVYDLDGGIEEYFHSKK